MKMSDERHRLWMELLEGIDDGSVMAAALHIVSTRSDWPPDIALLRTTALTIAAGEQAAPTGSEAWAGIATLIGGRDVDLTPRQLQALKSVGTLYDLKRSTNSTSDRARFIEAYDAIAERERKTREMLPAVAQLNAANALALGKLPPPPAAPELVQHPADESLTEEQLAENRKIIADYYAGKSPTLALDALIKAASSALEK